MIGCSSILAIKGPMSWIISRAMGCSYFDTLFFPVSFCVADARRPHKTQSDKLIWDLIYIIDYFTIFSRKSGTVLQIHYNLREERNSARDPFEQEREMSTEENKEFIHRYLDAINGKPKTESVIRLFVAEQPLIN